MICKPFDGFAGMLRDKTCGMRAVRPRRKERIGGILEDEEMNVRRERDFTDAGNADLVEKEGVDENCVEGLAGLYSYSEQISENARM